MKVLKLFASEMQADDLPAQVVGCKTSKGSTMAFEERFCQWRDSLFFIAYRVLGDPKIAAETVENCFVTASHNPPKFVSDGAFGSWILRILIDEAVLAHCQQKSRVADACEQAAAGLTMTIS